MTNLVLYHHIENMPLIKMLVNADTLPALFYQALCDTAQNNALSGNIIEQLIVDKILQTDNCFSRLAAAYSWQDLPNSLKEAALAEIMALQNLSKLPLPDLGKWPDIARNFNNGLNYNKKNTCYSQAKQNLLRLFKQGEAEQFLSELAAYHYRFGYGIIGQAAFFSWDNCFKPIINADLVDKDDLFAYPRQKEQVFANTQGFLAGAPAANLLLYGEKGCGKSSLVKAVANYYQDHGLKLVLVPRQLWMDLAEIMEQLALYRQKFIMFLDDFSFADHENEYKQIKSIIEGSVAAKPDNVLLYATTNRRHLIAESWQDRHDKQDDMYLADTTAEKLALADRFGLMITFMPPDQNQYLEMVFGLAAKQGIEIDKEQLAAQAIRWERWHNSRSGRTARQFIDDLALKQILK